MADKSIKIIWTKFAKHYPQLSLWIAKWNWVGLMLAGVAVQGAHEYAIALTLLIAGAVSITFSSFYWNGITDFPCITKMGRIFIFIIGVTLLPASYLWILNVKIDNPWSRFSTEVSKKENNPGQPKTTIPETIPTILQKPQPKQPTTEEIAAEVAKKIPHQLTKQTIIPPPEIAKLQFTFCPDGQIPEKFMDDIIDPPENGVVTVYVSAKNISTVHTGSDVKIWIIICEACKFAEDPQGSIPMQPHEDLSRRLQYNELYAGTSYDPFKFKIIPPSGADHFFIGMNYACAKCPPVDVKQRQVLRVNLIDDFLKHIYNRNN